MARSPHDDRAVPGPEASETAGERRDVVLIHGKTEDERGLRVLRAREGAAGTRLEVGELRPLEPGKPLHGDVVKLTQRASHPWICDVETQFEHPRGAQERRESGRRADVAGEARAEIRESKGRRSGPAQVASASYRQNWDAIWSSGARRGGSSEPN